MADERCGQAVLDFLSSTEVGSLVPPRKKEDDTSGEVSEWGFWERRERRERQEEWEGEAEAPGAGDKMSEAEELSLFLPTLHSWQRQARSRGRIARVFCSLLCQFLWARLLSLGTGQAEGKVELPTSRHRADCGEENRTKCTPP